MNAQTYGRVIHEWCNATGMQPWATGADMHVEVGDAVVGMLYDEENAPQLLHLYVDLGHVQSYGLHTRLLQHNIALVSPGSGYFALHPEEGNVVYRVSLPLTEQTCGALLPQQLADLIAHARARLFH